MSKAVIKFTPITPERFQRALQLAQTEGRKSGFKALTDYGSRFCVSAAVYGPAHNKNKKRKIVNRPRTDGSTYKAIEIYTQRSGDKKIAYKPRFAVTREKWEHLRIVPRAGLLRKAFRLLGAFIAQKDKGFTMRKELPPAWQPQFHTSGPGVGGSMWIQLLNALTYITNANPNLENIASIKAVSGMIGYYERKMQREFDKQARMA